ncbi:MAG: hypothetical protein ACFE0Q_01665 [Anaerolineae bacterium]
MPIKNYVETVTFTHRICMNYTLSFEDFFESIVDNFPYKLERTGYTQGDLEISEPNEDLEYSEEFTFEIGKILDQPLVAGGWIDLRRDSRDSELHVSGFFSIALNGDFENSKILDEYKALQGYYNHDTHTWELEIGVY